MPTNGEPYTITVIYMNGVASTFTGCASVVETDSKLTFRGKKAGVDAERFWTVMLANVVEYSRT